MEVENDVEFANISEVSIEDFNEVVDYLEHDQFVFVLVTERDEIKRSVALIDYLVILKFKNVGHFAGATDYLNGELVKT